MRTVDPFIYYAAAAFVAWLNTILCGQRLFDGNSSALLKLRSAALYILVLVLLFACPALFSLRLECLAAATVAGYIHFFLDRQAARR